MNNNQDMKTIILITTGIFIGAIGITIYNQTIGRRVSTLNVEYEIELLNDSLAKIRSEYWRTYVVPHDSIPATLLRDNL